MEIISLDQFLDANLHFELHYSSAELATGVVQISHGMAEHKGRYEGFISYLNDEGFHVIIHDHRGHGSRVTNNQIGFFGDTNGWQLIVDDLVAIHDKSCIIFPDLPKVLLGHSMGSWVAMSALQRDTNFDLALLSGSSYPNPMDTFLQKLFLKIEIFRLGSKGYSSFLHKVIFGGFNSKFTSPETPNDWLSRDSESVQNYTEDPMCGFVVSNQLWADVIDGVQSVFLESQLDLINKDMPILVFSGSDDPVGGMGKGTKKLHESLLSHGCKSDLYIIKDARHETLNEIDKINTYNYLITFLKHNLIGA